MATCTRRSFVRTAALMCGGIALSACSQPAPAPGPTSAPSPAPPAPASSPVGGPPAPAAFPPAPVSAPTIFASPSAVGQRVHVRGAWVALTTKALLYAVALEAGYFDKYGVDFELTFLNGSSPAAAGLISGSLDTVTTTGSAIATAQAAGQDLIMVAGFINQVVYRVVGRPEIATMDDLKGKAISVSRVGQTDYFVWQSILQKLGWQTDDVTYVNGNSQPGELTLVVAGQAYALAISPPLDLQAEQAGLHQILDATTMDIPDQDVGLVVARSYVTEHRDTVLAVLKASIEAMHRWQQDPTFTKTVIAKYLNLTDPAVIDEGWSAYAPVWPQAPFPSQEGLLKEIQEVGTQIPAAASLTVDQVSDTSLVQELVDNGFIQQVYAS